ncbi:hypothetical protein BDV19DRAFT_361536 [Aspergillus venezuelensis]
MIYRCFGPSSLHASELSLVEITHIKSYTTEGMAMVYSFHAAKATNRSITRPFRPS